MPKAPRSNSVEIVKTSKPGFRFMADAYDPAGKRVRRYFRSKPDAERYRAQILQAWARAEQVEPTRAELEALALARRHELDLPGIVAAAVAAREAEAAASPLTVSAVAADWLKSLEAAGRSASHRRSCRITLDRAAALWGDPKAASVTPEHVGAMMKRDPKATASTQASHRRILHGFFGFAVEQEIRPDNPAAKVKAPRIAAHSDDIEILTPAECRGLIVAAHHYAPTMIPALAIQLFAGVRSGELQRLTWADVRMDRGLIVVKSGKAKTGNRRMVSVLPCLDALLRPFVPADPETPVWPPNGPRLWDRILKGAGWRGKSCWEAVGEGGGRPWPRNALRHSFVSYHLGALHDAARTALEAGHSQEILFRHYRELVGEDEAAEFWTVGLIP